MIKPKRRTRLIVMTLLLGSLCCFIVNMFLHSLVVGAVISLPISVFVAMVLDLVFFETGPEHLNRLYGGYEE